MNGAKLPVFLCLRHTISTGIYPVKREPDGDGVLSLIQQNGGSDFDSYIFDPMDPVPTKGGVNFHFFGKVRQKVFHSEKYPSPLIHTVLNKE